MKKNLTEGNEAGFTSLFPLLASVKGFPYRVVYDVWSRIGSPNQPAAGTAGIMSLLIIKHPYPGVPEPQCSA